jgi:nucleoside-diphosphate-sugar epimerase
MTVGVLRLHHVYGPNESRKKSSVSSLITHAITSSFDPQLHSLSDTPYVHDNHTLRRQLNANHMKLKPKGNYRSIDSSLSHGDYVYVDDVVNAFVAFLNLDDNQMMNEVFLHHHENTNPIHNRKNRMIPAIQIGTGETYLQSITL